MARIVHICPRYSPARGGVELFFEKISEELARRGHSVQVWTTDAPTVRAFTSHSDPRLPAGPESIDGVLVRRFPVRYFPAQRYLRTAAHLLPFGTRWKVDTLRWTPLVPSLTHEATHGSAPVDLVHAAGLPYSSLLFAGVRLAEHTAAPLIVSPFNHVAPPGAAGARMSRAYVSPLNMQLIGRADRVFVQTGFEREVLAAAGLSTERQTVVGLGVEAVECTGGSRERFRHAHGVSDETVAIGHLANKSWDKGTVDLLDAAEALWSRGVSFTLILAGAEMESFTRRWARVRFPERVVNLGVLSDEQRRDFYAAIDIFALPSYVESFGLSPLEAALNGAAVVAYDHGGPGQIFRDGVDALLPAVGDIGALGDALARLIGDTGLRARLAAAGAIVARTYSWARVLDVAIGEYDGLLQDRSRRHRP
jgi:glycosyltransferase involved in cell wall biosynthesis